jgi:hypothetical protein
MQQDRRDDSQGTNRTNATGGGPGRRSFLEGAATTLVAAGALGTSVTSAAAGGDSVTTVEFDLAGIERRIEDGDTLRLTLSTTDAMFFNSRTSAGVRIDNSATELRLPVATGSGLDDDAKPKVARIDAGLSSF